MSSQNRSLSDMLQKLRKAKLRVHMRVFLLTKYGLVNVHSLKGPTRKHGDRMTYCEWR